MKKIVSILLTFVLLLCITSPNSYAIGSDAIISGDAVVSLPRSEQIRKEKIETLLDERAYFQIDHPDDAIGLTEIDDQLKDLGVDFLDDHEVQQLMQEKGCEQIAPYASVPATSPNNTWITYRTSNYSYNGKKYNIQTVVVYPQNHLSKLAHEETAVIEYPDQSIFNLPAFLVSIVKTYAGTVGGGVAEPVPYIISFYDAFKEGLSGLQTASIVKFSKITYDYDIRVSATFEFTRLENEPDTSQSLSFIQTKAQGNLVTIVKSGSYSHQSSLEGWNDFTQQIHQERIYVNPIPDYPGSPSIPPSIYGYTTGMRVKAYASTYDICPPYDKTHKDLSIRFLNPNNLSDCE